tara:strand:+ start:1611 stop:2105 length:495 start_codon:yes stop_codon:yes gene_type:complete
MISDKISILITGGTFDKEYDEINGILSFKKTQIHEMLHQSRAKIEFEIKTLMLIDSLEMSDKQREEIVNNCAQDENNKIIITHGTDTIAETGQAIINEKLHKCIILTGAMIPIKFGSSDGLFNLGCAVGLVQSLKNGVYVAMNGNYFPANKVKKNIESGSFEEV